jgi:hypothetical protein
VLLDAVVFDIKALFPKAVLFEPVVLNKSAAVPKPELLSNDRLAWPAEIINQWILENK